MNYKLRILLLFLVSAFAFVFSGCMKHLTDSVISNYVEQSEVVSNINSDCYNSEENSELSKNENAEKNEYGDGNISIITKDVKGNIISKVYYDSSADFTEKIFFEYDEKGDLIYESKYTADGNTVDDFLTDNYEKAKSFEETSYKLMGDYIMDTENVFAVTIEEFAPLYSKAKEIWDNYGVTVLIADKVTDFNNGAERCLEYDKIESCLQLIEKSLSCYPENFFNDFSGDVYIQLVGAGSSAGLYWGGYNQLLLQIDANCYNPSEEYDDKGDYFCYTLHHEIAHMITKQLLERAHDSKYPLSEEKWNSFNPNGFEYVNAYNDEKELEIYRTENNYEYFISSYGCSTPDEDRAMIFGEAMVYYQGYERMAFNTKVSAKLKYLSDCIRYGFVSDAWGDTAPWEYILYK